MSWQWEPKKKDDPPTREEFDKLQQTINGIQAALEIVKGRAFNTAAEVQALKNLVTEIEHELAERVSALEGRV